MCKGNGECSPTITCLVSIAIALQCGQSRTIDDVTSSLEKYTDPDKGVETIYSKSEATLASLETCLSRDSFAYNRFN